MDIFGLLTPGDIDQIQELRLQGLQTELDLQDPPLTATIRRWDETSSGMVDVPGAWRVVVRYANAQAGEIRSQSSEGSMARGTIEAFSPFPIQIGDRVALSSGGTLVIAPPEPRTELGVVIGSWEQSGGAT
jgi:hypothetical protein